MKIGIIGCGYVGQAVALQWKKDGNRIAVTTRQPNRISHLQHIAEQVHLLTPHSFGSFLEEQEAVLISVAPDALSDYTSTYLKTAEQVATYAKQAPLLQQILYISSTAVYGDHEGAWVDENTSINCESGNRKVLYETEQILLKCQSKNLNICILRLGEIYGPGREIEKRLRNNQNRLFAGTGQSYTNLIHLTDIVKALTFALNKRLKGIYNLCNDFHIPRHQFYVQICQKENLSPIQWDPTRTSPHSGNRRVSNQKIKNEGFIFSYPEYLIDRS